MDCSNFASKFYCRGKNRGGLEMLLEPDLDTKDEISEMFYGLCGEQRRKEEDFLMKLDGD